MVARGFRTFLQGVAMQKPNEEGFNRQGVYVVAIGGKSTLMSPFELYPHPPWLPRQRDQPGARAVEAGTARGLPARSDQGQFTGHPQTFGIPFASTPQLFPPVQSVPSWQ